MARAQRKQPCAERFAQSTPIWGRSERLPVHADPADVGGRGRRHACAGTADVLRAKSNPLMGVRGSGERTVLWWELGLVSLVVVFCLTALLVLLRKEPES
jgi:hypothetical protein